MSLCLALGTVYSGIGPCLHSANNEASSQRVLKAWLGCWPSQMLLLLQVALNKATWYMPWKIYGLGSRLSPLRSTLPQKLTFNKALRCLRRQARRGVNAWCPGKVMAACWTASSSAPLASDLASAATTSDSAETCTKNETQMSTHLLTLLGNGPLVCLLLRAPGLRLFITAPEAWTEKEDQGLASLHHELARYVQAGLGNVVSHAFVICLDHSPPALRHGVHATLAALQHSFSNRKAIGTSHSLGVARAHSCQTHFLLCSRKEFLSRVQAPKEHILHLHAIARARSCTAGASCSPRLPLTASLKPPEGN